MPPLLPGQKGLERPGEPAFERAEFALGDAMDARMFPFTPDFASLTSSVERTLDQPVAAAMRFSCSF